MTQPRRALRQLVLGLLLVVTVVGLPAIARAAPHTADTQVDGGGTITGRVTDVNGQPAAMLRVSAYPGMGGGVPDAFTDNDGVYRIEDLSPDEWRIAFSRGLSTEIYYSRDRDYGRTYHEATPIRVEMGQVISGIDQRLPAPVTLSGVVVDRNGNGLANAYVFVQGDCCLEGPGVTTTKIDGSWSITDLKPDRYAIQAVPMGSPASHAPVWFPDGSNFLSATLFEVGEGTQRDGIRLVVPETGSVTGRVLGPLGLPAKDACVTATDPYDGTNVRGIVPPDRSDEHGEFTISGMPPGQYRLEIGACADQGELWAGEFYRDATHPDAATPVTVLPGQATPVGPILVGRGGEIGGRIAIEGGASIRVAVEATSPAAPTTIVRRGDDGRYALRGLAPGPWTLRFIGAEHQSSTLYHPGVSRREDAQPIMVEEGQATTFDITLPAPNTVGRRDSTRPSNVSVERLGSTAVIRWDPPSDDGGNLISEYAVVNQTARRLMHIPARDTVTRVTNLPPGDAVFSVHTNYDGTAPWSFVSDIPADPSSGGPETPPPPATSAGQGAGTGYWMLTRDGATYPFGQAASHGDTAAVMAPGGAVDIDAVPGGRGFWLLGRSGVVRAFGDAGDFGHHGLPPGDEATSLSAHPTGKGYWAFSAKGAVLADGAAQFYGSLSGIPLNGPVRDSVATPSGKGYHMVADDGGVFAFGDARFLGSMGGTRLNAPVVGLAPTPSGKGYWLVAADGGIFTFGDATFRGSTGGTRLNQPVIGMVPYGDGYVLVARDGGVFNFSSLPFHGSLGGRSPASPVVGIATVGRA